MGFKVGYKNAGGEMTEKFKKTDKTADATNPKMGRLTALGRGKISRK
jgi:hypothetical protein